MASNATSFLSTIGGRLKSFFEKLLPIAQAITKGAVVAEPIVDLALAGAGQPAAATLYNTVTSSVLGAETAAAAAASQTGTGTQKAAAVLSDPSVQAAFATFEKAVGVTAHSTEQQLGYVSAVVATLNSLNGVPAPPPPAAS
jgi:hypothetical protein